MQSANKRLAIGFVSAAFAALLVAAGCGKKEDAGGSTQETTPVTKSSEPGAGGGSGKMDAPQVAIGAERTVSFSGPTTKLADTPEYDVSVKVPDSATAGVASNALLILHPKTGWKLNEEFPYSLVVTPPSGVKVAKAMQAKADAVLWEQKKSAEWAISFTPAAAGTVAFAAEFDFAVCTDATCNPYSEKVAFNVEVK